MQYNAEAPRVVVRRLRCLTSYCCCAISRSNKSDSLKSATNSMVAADNDTSDSSSADQVHRTDASANIDVGVLEASAPSASTMVLPPHENGPHQDDEGASEDTTYTTTMTTTTTLAKEITTAGNNSHGSTASVAVVKLNVGGKLFITTLATLTRNCGGNGGNGNGRIGTKNDDDDSHQTYFQSMLSSGRHSHLAPMTTTNESHDAATTITDGTYCVSTEMGRTFVTYSIFSVLMVWFSHTSVGRRGEVRACQRGGLLRY